MNALKLFLPSLLVAALAACAVGPDYKPLIRRRLTASMRKRPATIKRVSKRCGGSNSTTPRSINW
jgi:hypothetical protein